MGTEWTEYRPTSGAVSHCEGGNNRGPGSSTLLPWTSLGYEQLALTGAVVLGFMVAPGFVGGPVGTILGFGFAGMALYAAWTTRWLSRMSEAPRSGLVAGVITVGLVIVLAVTAYWLLKAAVFLGMVVGYALHLLSLIIELFSFLSL